MPINRLNGEMLQDNLLRQGVDLAFETDLLYLDVVNGRIGIKQGIPTVDLDVAGTVLITGQLTVDDLLANGNTLTATTGNLILASTSGQVDVNNHRIVNCADPVGALDVVNLQTLTSAVGAVTGDQIISDNSFIKVFDDGIAAGYFDFQIDGANVGTFTASLFNIGPDLTTAGVLTSNTANLGDVNVIGNIISSDTGTLAISGPTHVDISGDVSISGSGTHRVYYVNHLGHVDTKPVFTFTNTTDTLQLTGIAIFDSLTLDGTGITSASTLELDTTSNGELTITTGSGEITMVSSSALNLPSGTTAERPGAPDTGAFRYNEDDGQPEFFDGAFWHSIQREFTVTSQQITPSAVTAGAFVVGYTYQIVSAGTTNFIAIGAADNNPGTIFTATGIGSGTGTADPYDYTLNKAATTDGILVIINGVVQDPQGGAVYSASGTKLSFTDIPAPTDIISIRFLEF